jgi:hypothetical protein
MPCRNRRFITRLLWLIPILIAFWGFITSGQAQSRPRQNLLKIDGKYQPVHGINLAWLNGAYGHDFGHLPAHPDWKSDFDAGDLDRYFAEMRRMNLNVVRIFVFEDLEGLEFDDVGCVKRIEPQLLDNFDVTVTIAKKHGLHLYLCLANNYRKSCRTINVKDIVSDLKARRAYLANVVGPFTAHFKNNPAVFALDVMNEPEQDVAGPTGNYSNDGCDWRVMRSFIRDNATSIHKADPGRLVSCGSGWHGGGENIKAGIYSGLGLDFYDFHEYRNDGYLPPVRELGVNLPVIVGEFSQDDQKVVEDDELQRAAVEAFLRNARDGGYAGAIYWDYDHPNAPGPAHLRILRGRGSSEWRPAAHVMRDFQWKQATPLPSGSASKARRKR